MNPATVAKTSAQLLADSTVGNPVDFLQVHFLPVEPGKENNHCTKYNCKLQKCVKCIALEVCILVYVVSR